MAVAEIIGAAIGVLLLIVVAYLLVGNVIATAEIITNAQKDVTLKNEARLNTEITIGNQTFNDMTLNFSVVNTGNEAIVDYPHMDVYSYEPGATDYVHYRYDKYDLGDSGNWSIKFYESDYVHPKSLDPGETMWCHATYSGAPPIWFAVSTGNGAYASAYL